MIMGGNEMSEYCKVKKGIEVFVGEFVWILCELQEMSQNDLVIVMGIVQFIFFVIENDCVCLGVECVKVLVCVLCCYLVVLVFFGWDVGEDFVV